MTDDGFGVGVGVVSVRINDAIVEVRENLRINFEDDLTREGALARFIERHPYRLWTVGRQRCRIC